jgi:outer membrane protein assembly factor BamB
VIRVPPPARSRAWFFVPWLVSLLVLAAVALTNVLRSGGLRPAPLVGGFFLSDVNGDGVDDVVSHAVYIGDDDLHLRAIDGVTGHLLWASEPWLKSSQDEVVAAVPGALVVLVNGTGRLVDPRTGTARLTFALPERPRAVCRDGVRSLIVTRDDQTYALDVATGALQALGKAAATRLSPPCAPAPNDAWASHNGALQTADFDLSEGGSSMSVRSALREPGAQVDLVVGERAQGSRVPMVGGRAGGRIIWTSDVPSTNPLNTQEGEPTAVTVAAGRALVAYLSADEQTLNVTAFSLANGQRLWDVALPPMRRITGASIGANANYAYVWMTRGPDQALHRLNVTNGQLDWSI